LIANNLALLSSPISPGLTRSIRSRSAASMGVGVTMPF
jgi:hypothetical protein